MNRAPFYVTRLRSVAHDTYAYTCSWDRTLRTIPARKLDSVEANSEIFILWPYPGQDRVVIQTYDNHCVTARKNTPEKDSVGTDCLFLGANEWETYEMVPVPNKEHCWAFRSVVDDRLLMANAGQDGRPRVEVGGPYAEEKLHKGHWEVFELQPVVQFDMMADVHGHGGIIQQAMDAARRG
jgi:hypothetical protein